MFQSDGNAKEGSLPNSIWRRRAKHKVRLWFFDLLQIHKRRNDARTHPRPRIWPRESRESLSGMCLSKAVVLVVGRWREGRDRGERVELMDVLQNNDTDRNAQRMIMVTRAVAWREGGCEVMASLLRTGNGSLMHVMVDVHSWFLTVVMLLISARKVWGVGSWCGERDTKGSSFASYQKNPLVKSTSDMMHIGSRLFMSLSD
jgi:hypothetical protein